METAFDLIEENFQLKNLLAKKDDEIIHLKELLDFFRRKHYAPKAEAVSSKQLGLFNEAEEILSIESDDGNEETEVKGYIRKKHRKRISNKLPRKDVIIDIPDNEKFCPHDGTPLKEIGHDIHEQVEYIPAIIRVLRTIKKKYGCPCCRGVVKTASAPPVLIPKSMASPSLLATIILFKFVDSLPLYRQEKIFGRIGFIVTRATMAKWVVQVANQMIPIYNLLEDLLLGRDYIQMDETPTQVLNEEGKKATSKSYMWLRYAMSGEPIVLYDYAPTRSGQVPQKLLEGFAGYLQCDGYVGYDAITSKTGITRVGCMDHCQRKFKEAYKSNSGKGVGKKAIIILKKIYKIEEKIRGTSSENRYQVRQSETKPEMEKLKKLVNSLRPITSPKSLAGKAINYAYNEWENLEQFLSDGKLEISNIIIENLIRPFAVGRKNWLFSASVEGAKASAILYGVIETAKSNGIPPFDYLIYVLEKLPTANTVDDFEKLLPLKSHWEFRSK